MFRRYPYWFWLITAVLLWSIATWRYYTGSYGMHPERMARTMSDDLQKREEAFKKLIADTVLLKKIVTPGTLNEKEVEALEELPFYFYAYNGLALHFWNNNSVIIDSAIQYGQRNGLLILDRGAFVTRTLELKGTLKPNTITVLFPIAYYYPFENKYIHSAVASGDKIPISTRLSETKAKGSFEIKDSDDKVAYYATYPEGGGVNAWAPGYLMLWLMGIATIISVVWIQATVRYLMRRKSNWALLFVMLAIIIGLRGLLYLFGMPFGLPNIPFFGPNLYAANAFLSSLGDVVLNILCLFWMFLVFLSYTPYRTLCDNVKDGPQRMGLIVVLIIGIVGLRYFFTHQIVSLVMDSSISFELSHFGSTNVYTIIGLCTIVTIVGLASLSVYIINIYLNKLIGNKWFKYLLVAITATLFVLLQKEEFTKFYVGLSVWLVLFVVLLDVKKLTIRKDLLAPNMVFWAIFICGFCTATIQFFNHVKERQTRKSFAERIITQRDNVTEYAFSSIANNIGDDEVIIDYFRDPALSGRIRLNEHFDALYLSGQLNRYTARIYLYNKYGEALPDNKDTVSISVFENQKQNAFPITPGILYYKEYAQDGHYYLASIPINDNISGDSLGFVYIDLALKPTASETVYPELLQPGSLQVSPIEDAYSYAVYINKSLISQTSDYPFPVYLRPYPRTAEFAFSEEEDASALWYKPTENRTVKVVHKHIAWIETVTIFSYLFGMVMLMTFFVAAYQFYLARYIDSRSKGKFRNITLSRRIHFSMLSLVFISFMVIGLVTVTFFNNQYNESNKTRLNSTMQVIAQSVHEYLRQQNALNEDSIQNIEVRNPKFKYFIANLANTQKVDINLFNNLGILELTSQDDIYDKALLARIIRPDAYRQLFIEHKSVYIQDESLGNLKYLSCYVPLRDEYGIAVGYLNVPYFASEKYLKNQISNILVTLINLYAFIFLISSMLTGFLTRWLTRTFNLIIQQFSRINLQKNERIEWPYDDEIGMLVKEYNKMVKKVEENAAILAQSERESAWREMARQVAHEIKNPLTPMKLNIQYLQQALRNDHPNAKEMAVKVSTSLIEQIDNLSYIASEFSNFAKMPEARPEELNLNELMDLALELYLNEQSTKVSISKTDEQLIVFSDRSQLLRVFTNLLENALQAIPEEKEGKIYVVLTTEDKNALISITDNGQGISPDVAERIFQPYFTTKSSGTGLGLAMTKKIIEFWQGQIWFETIEDEGTTFFIRLPIVEMPGTDGQNK